MPPGSLGAGATRCAVSDDRFYLDQYRRHGAIFKLFWGSGHLKVCVVGFPLARRLLNEHRGKLCPVTADITSLVPAHYLRNMSPDKHPVYRRLFIGVLRDDLVVGWERGMRAVIRDALLGLARTDAGAPSPKALKDALDSIATRILLMVVFGVTPESNVGQELESCFRNLGPQGYVAEVGPQQKTAFDSIRTNVLAILDELAADPEAYGDSILRRLASATPISKVDDTVIGNAIYMVERGHHDVRDLLRWLLKYVGGDASLVAELRATIARSGHCLELAEACVRETLRLDQAELLSRRALKPFEFAGYRIPAMSWVSILLREAHRDPAVFTEPDRFRPRRFVERSYSADEYAPFGIDEHQCIGTFLVIRMCALLVDELVKGFTWTVRGDGPRRFGHLHWEPSRSFSIALEPA